MPIVRGSSMMSLGTWKARSTKYQKFLNLSNVFMLITSTTLIFMAIVLIRFYHITKLDFWSPWFYWTPILMVILGLYTFATSVYGFLISNHENRCLISLTALFLAIAFLGQLFSVFTAMELRNTIERQVVGTDLGREMDKYGDPDNQDITDKWDEMQKELRCCGGEHFENGYHDWRNTNEKSTLGQDDVPDSCCHEYKQGCGKGKLKQASNTNLGIYRSGCVAILIVKLEDEVVPLMLVYTCVGVLLAIVELVTVALACAYVAQISRRKRREGVYSRAATAANDEADYLPNLTSKETNF